MNASKVATSKTAKTVAELLEQIRQVAKDGNYIYRGEARKHRKTSSSIYRLYGHEIDAGGFDINIVEEEVVSEAKMHTHETENDVILAQLQHYRGKTNQIDFSTDYLVALFFACDGRLEVDGRLILLKKETKKNVEIYKPTSPRNRIIAQKSIFVRSSKGFVEPSDEKIIIVPSRLKKYVLDYLNKYHGITAAIIYNDIHGYIAQAETHKNAYIHFYRGLTYQSKGEFAEAYKEYNKAIRINPNLAIVYNSRGIVCVNKGDHDLAVADFNKAIELNSNYAMAYSNRGIAYSVKSDYDLAIADYNKAIELDPNDAVTYRSLSMTYNNRGNTYSGMGEYNLAIADYNKAIEMNPNDAMIYNNRGDAYGKRGNHDLAIADYDKAIELDPNYVEAYNNRGYAYNNKGKYNLAIDDFNKAIELNPNYAKAYGNRSNAKKALKDHKGAKEDYETALRLAKQENKTPPPAAP